MLVSMQTPPSPHPPPNPHPTSRLQYLLSELQITKIILKTYSEGTTEMFQAVKEKPEMKQKDYLKLKSVPFFHLAAAAAATAAATTATIPPTAEGVSLRTGVC